MLNLSAARRNKIDLNDYDYERDIQNRLLLSSLTPFDVEVLEEILMSSIRVSIPKLGSELGCEAAELMASLQKLAPTGLFEIQDDTLVVDKEMRKYFEAQIEKFEEDFQPNMEFAQSLLKKVPIHVLPAWYSIPRTSTNIFESLVEKDLATPRLFQRYLLELNFGDQVMHSILEDVFSAPDFKIYSSELREKYNLSRPLFEEYMLHLEFNFICCLSYELIDDQWQEVVTPFHEWRQYLSFLRDTAPNPLPETGQIIKTRPEPGAFAHDFIATLKEIMAEPVQVDEEELPEAFAMSPDALGRVATRCGGFDLSTNDAIVETATYFNWVLQKLWSLSIIAVNAGYLVPLPASEEWLQMSRDDVALAIYKHPRNRFVSGTFGPAFLSDKNLREAERALHRVSESGWIFLDDFLKGSIAPVGDLNEVRLKQQGRRWEYELPQYSDEHQKYIQSAIFERMFEAGFVETGLYDLRPSFRVTDFGRAILSLG